MTDDTYQGEERRQYCAMHADMEENMKKTVPRWIFLLSTSTMITLAVIVIGLTERRYNMIQRQITQLSNTVNTRVDKQLRAYEDSYRDDVQRFFDVAYKNGVKLDEMRADISTIRADAAEFKALQILVLKKIKLSE